VFINHSLSQLIILLELMLCLSTNHTLDSISVSVCHSRSYATHWIQAIDLLVHLALNTDSIQWKRPVSQIHLPFTDPVTVSQTLSIFYNNAETMIPGDTIQKLVEAWRSWCMKHIDIIVVAGRV
jgi:hypothetical protein